MVFCDQVCAVLGKVFCDQKRLWNGNSWITEAGLWLGMTICDQLRVWIENGLETEVCLWPGLAVCSPGRTQNMWREKKHQRYIRGGEEKLLKSINPPPLGNITEHFMISFLLTTSLLLTLSNKDKKIFSLPNITFLVPWLFSEPRAPDFRCIVPVSFTSFNLCASNSKDLH